jgi:MFS family permease
LSSQTAAPNAARTAAQVGALVDDARARRNARILAVAQTLYGCTGIIMVTSAGLVGQMLAENKALATVPISMFVLGTAALTVPASLVMRRVGRRAGFMAGAGIGAIGAAGGAAAIWIGSFAMFAAAMALLGAFQATAMYYRFAAADVASDAFKAKAISWVLAGGVAAAILGPQILIHSRDLLAPLAFAGAYGAMCAVALAAMAVLSFVDIPGLAPAARANQGRPIGVIMAQPKFIVAVICAMASYSMMTLLMTATPIAMVACDLTVEDAAFVVQWHAVAMFAPSFFTGNLINRFGTTRIILTGVGLQIACGIVALSGVEIEQFTIALALLGLGWNFGFIGATKLVTETYRPEERNKVQAANDFLVFGAVASASFLSGVLLQSFGWSTVVMALFPLTAVTAVLVGWSALRRGSEAAM